MNLTSATIALIALSPLSVQNRARLVQAHPRTKRANLRAVDTRGAKFIFAPSADAADIGYWGEWKALASGLGSGTATAAIGRGSGRLPTPEAVLADLFEMRRECQFKEMKEPRI
jgi:hypothetical protein